MLRHQFKDSCTSQSSNDAVLTLYAYILEHENADSDWWNEDHGANDIIALFETVFAPLDWEALKEDLPHWTTFQLELFTQSIMGGYSGYTGNADRYYDPGEEAERVTQTLSNRLKLIVSILEIEKLRKLAHNDLSYVVNKEIDFIVVHLEMLMKQDPVNSEIMRAIVRNLGMSGFDNAALDDLKRKIINFDNVAGR